MTSKRGYLYAPKELLHMAEIISKIVLVIILIAEHLKGGKPNV